MYRSHLSETPKIYLFVAKTGNVGAVESESKQFLMIGSGAGAKNF